MAERGIVGEVADEIFEKLAAFANFGFPESHSVSFAYLVYASSWLKLLLPGRVLRGAAGRPADGLLLAADAWSPTPAGTAWWCAAPTSTRIRGRADAWLERPGGAPPVSAVAPGWSDLTVAAGRGPDAVGLGPVDRPDVAARIAAGRPFTRTWRTWPAGCR